MTGAVKSPLFKELFCFRLVFGTFKGTILFAFVHRTGRDAEKKTTNLKIIT